MRKSLATALILLAGTLTAAAQDWPSATVKIVVPFAAGATPDIVARLIADRLHNTLDRTFIVENRPGASGNTGTDTVAKAAPDGSTIGVRSADRSRSICCCSASFPTIHEMTSR